jgi:DNA helicase-2/ATP-dependent DNA helicase PcrA
VTRCELLLDQWAGERDDVCVVGDPRQTIYSFTGATPAYLTGFALQYPGATVIHLVRNYRSTPQVVALANKVLATAGPALVAQRAAGPAPQLTEYGDEPDEAADVARQAAALIKAGTPQPYRRARRPAMTWLQRRWPLRACGSSCAGPSASLPGLR